MLKSRPFAASLALVLVLAAALRVVYPTADPPWQTTVGIVWHDEGTWVHNARNRVLFGAWTLDAWNPLYIAPVFTGLQYLSFDTFGVGIWQARLVSELTGLVSVLLLALGIRRVAGRESALIAAAFLATDYVYVMWNRAALMEASMVAFMVAAWYCYARAQKQPMWAAFAAVCAMLAYFTKAAAVCFVAALGVEATVALVRPASADNGNSRRAAAITLAGLVAAGFVALAVFVLPNWTEYWFYNWQMSVTRKPSYDFRAVLDRVTWFPILHDIFTRMWFSVVVGTVATFGAFVRWRSLPPGERLLALWIVLGALELLVHDVGNERRFILFIPPLAAVTAIVLGRDRRLLPPEAAGISRRRMVVLLPALFYGLYVIIGALVRLAYLYEPGPGVRLSAAIAFIGALLLVAGWPRVARFLSAPQSNARTAAAITLVVCAGQLVQYVQWAKGRTYKNYEASVQLASILPPDTLVHGKLANGLSLENRIRPIFVGREFGNYSDRKQRDDVRYILTYVAPYVGYEGRVILDVLDAYPDRLIIRTFDVAETTGGHDRAALIDKFGKLGKFGKVGNVGSIGGQPAGAARAHD